MTELTVIPIERAREIYQSMPESQRPSSQQIPDSTPTLTPISNPQKEEEIKKQRASTEKGFYKSLPIPEGIENVVRVSNYGNINPPSPQDSPRQYNNFMQRSHDSGYSGEKFSTPGSVTPNSSAQKVPRENFSWEINYSELKFERELGRGSYGIVYKAIWRKAQVAVKLLYGERMDANEFLLEAQVLMKLRPHSNVVQLQGICFEPVCIIYEFMGGGSLYDLLFKSQDTLVSYARVISWLNQIAAGMVHLHREKIIHRDLASRNILLTKDNTIVKISDFGMSRAVEDAASGDRTHSSVGPLKWMAPENLLQRQYSAKSDVWSFGVLTFEVAVRKEPYPGLEGLQVATQISSRSVNLVSFIPKEINPFISQLISSCTEFLPSQRIDFDEISDLLQQHLSKLEA